MRNYRKYMFIMIWILPATLAKTNRNIQKLWECIFSEIKGCSRLEDVIVESTGSNKYFLKNKPFP